MKFQWSIAPPQPELSAQLAAGAAVSPLLAQCLANRGFTQPDAAAQFLRPRLQSLADPYLIPNMAPAVERLLAARTNGEKMVAFGDYDVDGVTATALLLETMTALGWKMERYLPSRMDEGYGLTPGAAQSCVEKFEPRLLLAVDCGSTAVDTIAWLNGRGVDVIVLDHHQVSSPPPAALALVNPQLATTAPGFRELCSAGLAFKLVHALLKRLRADGDAAAAQLDLRQFLDYVALGTVADIVPVIGENRILIRAGLEQLNVTPRAGLIALKAAAGVLAPITGMQVGFQLAPRLNAAGRLEDAEEALRLLLSRDPVESELIARSLDARNRQRQQIERAIFDEALDGIQFDAGRDYAIVEGRDGWHIGVVGIVASRLSQKFHRPAIVFGGDGAEWRGSGRSIDGFDLAGALRECAPLLLRHGGHAMAAGLSMAPANLGAFRGRLNELARAGIAPERLRPRLELDAAITLDEMTLDRVEELAKLEPCGPANPPIRLAALGVGLREPPRRIGKEKQHAKFRVTDGAGDANAVWWQCGDAPLPYAKFDIAFTPTIDEFQGRRAPALRILDWRPA